MRIGISSALAASFMMFVDGGLAADQEYETVAGSQRCAMATAFFSAVLRFDCKASPRQKIVLRTASPAARNRRQTCARWWKESS